MTSKSPDPISDDHDPAESRPLADGSAGSGASAVKLADLREAMTEIDQRHAEGESGFFAELAPEISSKRSATKKKSAKRSTSKRASSKSKREASSAVPDFLVSDESSSVPDFLPADALASNIAPFADSDDADGSTLPTGGLFFDDDAEDDEPDFDADYAKAKKSAMNMLAMRDHSSEELREKLLKRDLMPEAVDELIVKLQKSRLLNDEEYAQRYVRAHRERRKLSRSALRRELNKKGIAQELIAEVVAEVDGEEDLARQVAEKKAASTRNLDYQVRERRILGMLARRGFASSVCIKVTCEVLAED